MITRQEILLPMYQVEEVNNHSNFLYNLSLVKEKLHQVESLATIIFLPDHTHVVGESTPAMATLVQEIIVAATSMMFSCQQMSLDVGGPLAQSTEVGPSNAEALFPDRQDNIVDHDHWLYDYNSSDDHNYNNSTATTTTTTIATATIMIEGNTNDDNDIVELNAGDLLAKYTHYCQVCGKGFKRDANLRMHMRAHGEQYKSNAALKSPGASKGSSSLSRRKLYSCPQEGCRWNKKHAKFRALKSMICVKNHYRRSHCPKMYVCKRCAAKHFSVLSDLRTHEKHCGDSRWRCSCGTTFSRKDKLVGHIAVFVGHAPAVSTQQDSSEKKELDR